METGVFEGAQPPVVCPVCGEALCFRDSVYTLGAGDALAGCSLCLHRHDALEWLAGEAEDMWGAERYFWEQ